MPWGRLIQPEDVARLTLFLLSDVSIPMTGALIDQEQIQRARGPRLSVARSVPFCNYFNSCRNFKVILGQAHPISKSTGFVAFNISTITLPRSRSRWISRLTNMRVV